MKDYSLGKVVRAADGAGLENQCAVTPYQEFESLTFRGSADFARFRGRPGAIERSFRPALLVPRPGVNLLTGLRIIILATGNGGLTTSVLFNNPAFPTRAAAKAWMATDQYAQLKALLISLNYV